MKTPDDRSGLMTAGQRLNAVLRTIPLKIASPIHAVRRTLYRSARGTGPEIGRLHAVAMGRSANIIRAIGWGIRRTVHGAGAAIALVFWSTVKLATKVRRRIVAAIALVFWPAVKLVTKVRRRIVAAIALVFWSAVKLATKVRRRIVAAITSAFRSSIGLVTAVWPRIVAAITSAFRSSIGLVTAVWPHITAAVFSAERAILRSTRWTGRSIATGAEAALSLAAIPYRGVRRAAGLTVGTGSRISAGYRTLANKLAATTMTLSVEDGHARLLVLKGDRIVAWRSGQIAQPREEPSADPEDDPAEDPAEEPANATELEGGAGAPVINPLGPLLKGLPFNGKRVVADLPLYVPLLRHVPVPDVKGRYLNEIVTAEVLDSVPFAEDEVDIHWRVTKGAATKEPNREVSVIAVPREHMDGQVGIIRDSHLIPSAVYTKAAALAAAVGRPDVFILHLALAQTAVILVRGGVIRIVHRLELPQDTNEQAEAIAMGVGQVAGYHRSQRPDDDVSELPFVVTGEVNQMQGLLGPLATTLDRPVQVFHWDLQGSDGFDPAEYVSNIGLYLAFRSRGPARLTGAQNVLPERHRPRPLPVAPAAVFTVLLGLGFLAFNLTGWISGVAGEQGPLNAKMDIRLDQARTYRLSVGRQSVIEQRIADAEFEALELETDLLFLKQEMDLLLSRIRDIMDIAGSSDVELSRMVPMPEGFSVSGTAETYSDVLGYAASMRSSPNFEDATVLQVANSSESRLGFTVVVTIPAPESEDDEGSDSQARNP